MKFNVFYEFDDERENRRISVFDFDSTLISLKPRINEIFSQRWIRGPDTIDWDGTDWRNWEDANLFVLDPDDSELAVVTESKGIKPLTENEVDMFRMVFKNERFIRPVPKYKKFFVGSHGKSASNDSAMDKYYRSPRTLDPDMWNKLHDHGPILDIAKERSADNSNNIVYILTGRDNEEAMVHAIQDWLDSQGVRVPEFRIHAVGHINTANEKAKVLKEISEKFGNLHIDFFDDNEENIRTANGINNVNAIQV